MDDVVRLTDSLTSYSEAAADRLTDALADCFEQLGTYPESGRDRSEIAPETRSFALNRVGVTVYYILDAPNDVVMITRVLRQEQSLD